MARTANQERELREIAGRMGCEIVRVYKDHGISGAKGRDKRPDFGDEAQQKRISVVRSSRALMRYRIASASRRHSSAILSSRARGPDGSISISRS